MEDSLPEKTEKAEPDGERTGFPEFETVFILSGDREHVKRDRDCLREFKPKTVVEFASGAEALDSWRFYKVDLALVDSMLGDMDGVSFLRRLRVLDERREVPVVMITPENAKEAVLDAIAAGCDGYVLRPYSRKTYEGHVLMALRSGRALEIEEALADEGREKVSQGDFDGAIESFEELFSDAGQAQGYFDAGMRFLAQQQFGKAIAAFKRALKLNDLHAEAYKGMAEAYAAKGDEDMRLACLQRAAALYAETDRLEDCKRLFIEILKYDAAAPNPFNTLGVNLRKRGDVGGALRAYAQALELTPMDENIYYNMAKAYYVVKDRENCLTRLRQALALKPDFSEAGALYEKLAGTAWPALARTSGAPGGTGETGGTGPGDARNAENAGRPPAPSLRDE